MKIRFFILFLSVLSFGAAKADPPAEEGKALFTSRCASCHNVNKVLTGPALAGVHERRSMDWIISFVHSSQTMIKKGDKEAVALYEKFNRIPMPDHPDLSDDHIRSIVEYIKSSGKTEENAAPFVKPYEQKPAYTPLSLKEDWAFFAIFGVLVLLLVGVLLFAVEVSALKRKEEQAG